MKFKKYLHVYVDTMAEWSKALVLGTSLRAWVQIPLVSFLCIFESNFEKVRNSRKVTLLSLGYQAHQDLFSERRQLNAVMDLERELKEHGVQVVCSKMDTIVSMCVRGTSGNSLLHTLRLMDKYVSQKVAKLAKACEGAIYSDPCFGPNDVDKLGALALCKHGEVSTHHSLSM